VKDRRHYGVCFSLWHITWIVKCSGRLERGTPPSLRELVLFDLVGSGEDRRWLRGSLSD